MLKARRKQEVFPADFRKMKNQKLLEVERTILKLAVIDHARRDMCFPIEETYKLKILCYALYRQGYSIAVISRRVKRSPTITTSMIRKIHYHYSKFWVVRYGIEINEVLK